MRKVSESGRPTDTGVNNVSALINLPYFDIIESMGLDYTHAAVLGVRAQITNLVLCTLNPASF